MLFRSISVIGVCVFGCILERVGVIWLSFSLYNSALLSVLDVYKRQVQALMSYGGYEIEMKDGYEWLDLSNGGYIQVNGYPLILSLIHISDASICSRLISVI